MEKHKWHEVIVAWADGKKIQYKYINDNSDAWVEYGGNCVPPFNNTTVEWRVAPKITNEQRYYHSAYIIRALNADCGGLQDIYCDGRIKPDHDDFRISFDVADGRVINITGIKQI